MLREFLGGVYARNSRGMLGIHHASAPSKIRLFLERDQLGKAVGGYP